MTKRLSDKRLQEIRTECERLFERLGYTVIYGLGNFKDGVCLVQNERKLVVNQYTPVEIQVDFFLKVLRSLNLKGVYILPALRELVEQNSNSD